MRPFKLLLLLTFVFSLPASAGPDFKNLGTGDTQTVEQFMQDGQWLIVMFWASDCHVCNREAGNYAAFHEKHKDGMARVLGISLDGKSKESDAESFVFEHGVEFDNLIGEARSVVDYYQQLTHTAWIGTPSFAVFGPDGELKAKQVGAVPVPLIEHYIQSNGS